MTDESIRFRNHKNRVALRFRVPCVSAFLPVIHAPLVIIYSVCRACIMSTIWGVAQVWIIRHKRTTSVVVSSLNILSNCIYTACLLTIFEPSSAIHCRLAESLSSSNSCASLLFVLNGAQLIATTKMANRTLVVLTNIVPVVFGINVFGFVLWRLLSPNRIDWLLKWAVSPLRGAILWQPEAETA